MTSTSSHPGRYRADIDGLRAIAVAAVLLFHGRLGCTGGFVGVDVFFVISGFLITGLILKEADKGGFNMVGFWERRVRRIAPAMMVVVAACLVAGWFLLFPEEYRRLGESASWQAMLASNVYFWRQSGYFAPASELKPLLHTWSLAVEEQFYLLLPLVVMGLSRICRRWLWAALMAMGAGSLWLSIAWVQRRPTAGFYLLPTRAWELLLGSLIAMIPGQLQIRRWAAEMLSCAGLIAIGFAVVAYDRETPFPGVAALLPCAGTALLIVANGGTETTVGTLLSLRPVVWVGLISYSLYLWHWPVLVFADYWTLGTIGAAGRIGLLVLSVGLAAVSWRYIEMPVRRRQVFRTRGRVFWFGGAGTAMLAGAGGLILLTGGFPVRMPAKAVRLATVQVDRTFPANLSPQAAARGEFLQLGGDDAEGPAQLLVWGDSHATAVLPVIDVMCRERHVRGVAATHSATAPLLGYRSRGWAGLRGRSLRFNASVMAYVKRDHLGDVLLAANWEDYVAEGQIGQFRQSLKETVDALRQAGARVWIMKTVPRQQWDVPLALGSAVLYGRDPASLGLPLAAHRAASRRQDELLGEVRGEGVGLLDPTSMFLIPGQLCRMELDGEALYRDRQHLTRTGAMMLRPMFEPVFEGMSGERRALMQKGSGESVQ